MNVIIVEDDFIIADHLQIILNKHGVDVIDVFDNVNDALQHRNEDIDLYIIDIRLSGNTSGIELGRRLNKNDKSFIYLTANNELATIKEAVETKPVTYITKPYKESDIIAILELSKSKTQKKIAVKSTYGKKNINLSNLLYIKACGSYSELYTSTKSYLERCSLNQLEQTLNSNFIRIHRSYIINKTKIGDFTSSYVYINNKKIPISRSYKSNFTGMIK